MKISSVNAAGLANLRTQAASGPGAAIQTFKKTDPRLQQPSESVSVTLSPIDRTRIAPLTVSTPVAIAASPGTAIRPNSDVPLATPSPPEQKTDRNFPNPLGANSNSGNSIASPDSLNGNLENQKTEEQTRAASQQAANAQTEKPNNSANTAIAAYQRIFSL